jgi:leucyl-tRNA synthetase
MFMGPLEMVKPRNTQGVEGVYRFLGRTWRLFIDETSHQAFEQAVTAGGGASSEALLALLRLNEAITDNEPSPDQLKVLHACIKKVTEDLNGLRFNTAISALMVFVNEALNWETRPRVVLAEFLVLLQPFAPHLAEELWGRLMARGKAGPRDAALALAYQPWPVFDPALLVEDTLEIPVQVNGKLRDRMTVPATASRQDLETAALASDKARSFYEGKTVRKTIVVPGKLVNIVTD